MRKITKIWIMVSIASACIGATSLAYGDWSVERNAGEKSKAPPIVELSQEWKENNPSYFLTHAGPFTKVEFFITNTANAGVTFEKDTSISSSPRGWVSELPNPRYSLLYGTSAQSFFSPKSYLTTFFNDPDQAKFELVLVAWHGNQVVEAEEFNWLGNHWQNPLGIPLRNSPGNYDRSDPDAIPIPSAILLFAPGTLVVFLLGKRLAGNKANRNNAPPASVPSIPAAFSGRVFARKNFSCSSETGKSI